MKNGVYKYRCTICTLTTMEFTPQQATRKIISIYEHTSTDFRLLIFQGNHLSSVLEKFSHNYRLFIQEYKDTVLIILYTTTMNL